MLVTKTREYLLIRGQQTVNLVSAKIQLKAKVFVNHDQPSEVSVTLKRIYSKDPVAKNRRFIPRKEAPPDDLRQIAVSKGLWIFVFVRGCLQS